MISKTGMAREKGGENMTINDTPYNIDLVAPGQQTSRK